MQWSIITRRCSFNAMIDHITRRWATISKVTWSHPMEQSWGHKNSRRIKQLCLWWPRLKVIQLSHQAHSIVHVIIQYVSNLRHSTEHEIMFYSAQLLSHFLLPRTTLQPKIVMKLYDPISSCHPCKIQGWFKIILEREYVNISKRDRIGVL